MAFAPLASIILLAAVLAIQPSTVNGAEHRNAAQDQTKQLQSVSGKIASVDKNSFTLSVAAAHTASAGNDVQDQPAKTMTFMIDQNTTVDGKLKVGSNAEVTYRQDSGNNVAVSVRVTS
jgi:Cu/Ag efflux protein CusF